MITLRPSNERGLTDIGWLESRHSFSFGGYYDPAHMAFRSLRVINDDKVAGGMGFGTHPHRDMEIVTYVISGAVAHKDSLGHGATVKRGDVQMMSAGTGIRHSEFNPSETEPTHFLQIWIEPAKHGVAPRYEQAYVSDDAKRGALRLVASPDGAEGSLTIGQDARLFATLLGDGQEVSHAFAAGRHGWVQVAKGSVELNGKTLAEGDGASISNEAAITLRGVQGAEVLLFDLA